MIWGNLWAWLGLAALAIPIAVHLLARRAARTQRFPTLRFFRETKPLASRRARIEDVPLLLVRLLILACAVAGAAQPYLPIGERRTALGRTLTRAIVIDTSASMFRTASSGERAIDIARRGADVAMREAAAGVLIETAAPGSALDGARAWLDTKAGLREIVVLSDFQPGALDSIDLAVMPSTAGIRLHRVATDTITAPRPWTVQRGTREIAAHTTHDGERTSVTWSTRPAPAPTAPRILAGAGNAAVAEAALRAALGAVRTTSLDETRPIVIVFPDHERRDELLRSTLPIDAPWMADVITALRRDPLTSSLAGARPDPFTPSPSVVAAHDASGDILAMAARSHIDGRDHLLLVPFVEAGSLAGATLIAAAVDAATANQRSSETEAGSLSDEMLARWQREATPVPPLPGATGESDGRWLWLLALVLLVVESAIRRRHRETANEADSSPAGEAAGHERVA